MKLLGKARKLWVFFGALFALTGLLLLYSDEPWGFIAFGPPGFGMIGLVLLARARTLNSLVKVVGWFG